jgi:transcriptional regulator with XRE-family HTH domain
MTAEFIKESRKTLGLTQAALAERMGVSVDSVRAYEQSRRPVSKIVTVLIEKFLKENKS